MHIVLFYIETALQLVPNPVVIFTMAFYEEIHLNWPNSNGFLQSTMLITSFVAAIYVHWLSLEYISMTMARLMFDCQKVLAI